MVPGCVCVLLAPVSVVFAVVCMHLAREGLSMCEQVLDVGVLTATSISVLEHRLDKVIIVLHAFA